MLSKKHSESIKAWLDGAEVEFYDGKKWVYIENPVFIERLEYRIKPKEKVRRLVPFDQSDWTGLIGKTVKRRNSNIVFLIVGFTEQYVYLGATPIRYEVFKSDYELIDGSPCGKYIEE